MDPPKEQWSNRPIGLVALLELQKLQISLLRIQLLDKLVRAQKIIRAQNDLDKP